MSYPDAGPVLADICEAAGRLVLPLWKSGLAVHTKSDESPVTEADRRAEHLILAELARAFPDIHVVSEEHASEYGAPEAVGETFFLVDPIDGTKAFVRGDPNYTVNIGLVSKGRAVGGAIMAPVTGETWFTRAGRAFKRVNGGPEVEVRARVWPKGAAVALMSHTMKPETVARYAEEYGFDHPQAMDSSIKLCRLAEGSADLYPRHGPTMEWDICAGQAILEAAGGRIEAHGGGAFAYGKVADGFRNGWFIARGAA